MRYRLKVYVVDTNKIPKDLTDLTRQSLLTSFDTEREGCCKNAVMNDLMWNTSSAC